MSEDTIAADNASAACEARSYIEADLASMTVPGIHHILSQEPNKYPHKDGPLSLQHKKRPLRDILCKILLDPAHGYTTTMPVPDASRVIARPSKASKTAASRPTTAQKLNLIQKGIEEGTIKETPLSRQLKDLGAKPAIPAPRKIEDHPGPGAVAVKDDFDTSTANDEVPASTSPQIEADSGSALSTENVGEYEGSGEESSHIMSPKDGEHCGLSLSGGDLGAGQHDDGGGGLATPIGVFEMQDPPAHVYPLFNSDDFSHLLNQREPAETGDWLNVIIQITDSRAPAPAEPARHQVEVALYRDFRFVKLQDGTWKANAEMLANAIQTSGAVIKGPARLTLPGLNGFQLPFAVQEPGSNMPRCSIELIEVPSDGILSIGVASLGPMPEVAVTREPEGETKPAMLKRSASPDAILTSAATGPTKKVKKVDYAAEEAKVAARADTVEYLKEILKLRPGYELFKSSKNKTFHAADILRICTFAKDFIDDYVKGLTKTVVSEKNPRPTAKMNRILKSQVLDVLDRNSSWENEMKLIVMYAYLMGRPGETHYDAKVEEILGVDGSNGEAKIGWVGLVRVLKEAAENHGIV